MKNSNDTLENRTRDLTTCSAVPQPTAPPRTAIPNLQIQQFRLAVSVVSSKTWTPTGRTNFITVLCFLWGRNVLCVMQISFAFIYPWRLSAINTISDVVVCSVCFPYVSKRLLGTGTGFYKSEIYVLMSGFGNEWPNGTFAACWVHPSET
jgi:hypothetical protein